MTELGPVLTECPDNFGVIDKGVYRADAHPISCDWMMSRARRCNPHDELLRPDEPECPFPDADEELEDPHRRLQESESSNG